MNATNFIFDGKELSDFGFVICSWKKSNSLDDVTTDSQRNFNQASIMNGRYMPFTCSTYDKHLEMTFSIMKNPDEYMGHEMAISNDETREIKRWLNRPNACRFELVDNDYFGIFWEGSFNVKDVVFGGERYGFDLTLITNRPFALSYPTNITFDLEKNVPQSFYDGSDEIGYIYPNVVITCKESGDLSLTNSQDKFVTVIKNVTANEVITITPELQISSSKTSHNIADDFNYRFLRVGNSYNNNVNVLTSNLNCLVSLSYYPIAKVVI